MTPKEVLQAIVRALKNSTEFDGGTYIVREPDFAGADNTLDQPVVTVQVLNQDRSTEWDSDLVGYTTNDSGQETGRIFHAIWEMQVEVFINVAAGNQALDVSTLGGNLQTALLAYDSQQQAKDFPDGNGGTVPQIESFTLGDGERDDELSGPGIRRWRQELEVTFYHETTTDGEPITTIELPQTDDMTTDETDDAEVVWNY